MVPRSIWPCGKDAQLETGVAENFADDSPRISTDNQIQFRPAFVRIRR